MKARVRGIGDGGWQTRSVLECGSPLPLLATSITSIANEGARGLAQSKAWRRIFAVLLLTALPFPLAFGQSYSVDWSKVAGGGGTSTGGVYSVSGTIGQHDAGGPMTGGTYSLTGGFWALYAIQTPGAPTLRIFLTSTNTAVVAWPQSSTAWSLQQNGDLRPGGWANAGRTPTIVGNENQVIISPPAGNRFYRLSQ